MISKNKISIDKLIVKALVLFLFFVFGSFGFFAINEGISEAYSSADISRAESYCKSKYSGDNTAEKSMYSFCYSAYLSATKDPTMNISSYCSKLKENGALSASQINESCTAGYTESVRSSSTDGSVYLNQCNVVVNKKKCQTAIKKCNGNTNCSVTALNNASITGGKVVDFCRQANDPQQCQADYKSECKNLAGQQMISCKNNVANKNNVLGFSGSTGPILRGVPCSGNGFFGFPHWYEYLDSQGSGKDCVPVIDKLSDAWLVGLAVIEILIKIASIVAIIFVVYGGVKYIMARGNPEKITTARLAIQDALIGLVISVVAIVIIRYLGETISK